VAQNDLAALSSW